ncbi:NUDIX domain-containing protein [Streptococcus cuniculipharyngis]
MKVNKTVQDAIVREIKEELGVDNLVNLDLVREER